MRLRKYARMIINFWGIADMQTKTINEFQGEKFKNAEIHAMEWKLECYKNLIEEMSKKSTVTVLDVGGGAGYFAEELQKRIPNDVDLEIYVLDTHSYDTWNVSSELGRRKIRFVKGDALNMDNIFAEKTFDYIFCNMVFHHLLGDDFKSSERIRETVLAKIKKVLKDDGCVGIVDNYNDGLIVDSISCRIIYGLTSMSNPIIIRICRRFGSYSAGVGVCMLSRKMWRHIIEKCGMQIVDEIESTPDKLGILKKICLLNKRYSEYNLMVLKKSNN